MAANNLRHIRIILVFFSKPLKLFLRRLAIPNDTALNFLLPLLTQAAVKFPREVLAGIRVIYKNLNISRNRSFGEYHAGRRQKNYNCRYLYTHKSPLN